jgi:NTE family protein
MAKLTALVLQGGGALGAYEHGVAEAFYARRGPPSVITGVSIGAVNAAVLAGQRRGEDPIAALAAVWKAFSVEPPLARGPATRVWGALRGNRGLYAPRLDLLAATWLGGDTSYMFDSTRLSRTLEEHVDEDALNADTAPEVVVTAVNLSTGELERFANKGDPPLTTQHVLASASLPLAFPMTPVGRDLYWDGGLVSNTPLSEAINSLEALPDPDVETVREVVVVELFPRRSPLPKDWASACDRLFELVLANKLGQDQHLFENVSEVVALIRKLDEEVPRDSEVRESPAFQKLLRWHRKVDLQVVVTHETHEDVTGPIDFSETAIRRRYEMGLAKGLERLA